MSRLKHDKLWLEFVDWCRQRHLKPLPAHAWTVAAYLRWKDRQDSTEKPGTASATRLLKIISRAHLLGGHGSPHAHPVIVKTLASIERRRSTAPDRSDLFSLTPVPPQSTAREAAAADDGMNDDDEENDAFQVISGIRTNFSLRTRPKLVSKRISDI